MTGVWIANGHLPDCRYLRELGWTPWLDPEPCDCSDRLDDEHDDEDWEVTQ